MTPRISSALVPDQPQPQPPRQAQQPPAQPAQPSQPRTLDVTGKLARIRATGSHSLPPTGPTLTQKMRAIEPPDVARQVLDEQKMLAQELLTLPDALETSGLAKTHKRSYFETIRNYVDLAHETWIGIAEERLEQSGADQAYRQKAISIARQVKRLRNESQLAASNTQFPLPRKRPFFWRRRVRMQSDGLRAWQEHLHMPAEPRAMGAALARLRGATAMARASDFELLLWALFPSALADVVMVVWLGFIIALIAALVQGAGASVGALALAATGTLAVRVLLTFLVWRGPARLDYLFALSTFSTLRSPRAGAAGSAVIAGLLRAWGIVFALGGLLGMVAALGYSIWQIVYQPVTLPAMALDWVSLVGNMLIRATWLPALVGLGAVIALAIPLLLLSALRFIAELGGNVGWAPAARRYALAPALCMLVFLAAGVVATLAALAPTLGMRAVVLTTLTAGPVSSQPITLQTAMLFVAPALLLLVGLDIPYRIGVMRWRGRWLSELSARRADIDAHVRRLSAVDPQTGAQDTSEENLRAMQYDLVLLQFYKTRIEETGRVSSAPYGLLTGIGALIVLAVLALLVDGLAEQLAHLLLNVG
ncbi:MAG: hypothetical protein ACM3N4_07945 [Nitrososphaerota archaeon]